MSFASSNRTSLSAVRETVFGETPLTPNLQLLRFTGESLNYNLSNVTSNEIRADRMTSDLVQVQSDASGDLSIEMSYGSYDMFLEGAFASTYGAETNVSAADIDASDADNSFNSAGGDFGDVIDSQWVSMNGFSDPANNGAFRVVTATANKIIVDATLVTEAAGATVTAKGATMRNGVELISFTIQKYLADPTTPTYFNFSGARIGALDLNFQSGQILTGSFGVMALSSETDTSQIAGATELPASTTGVMNAVGNISNIYMDGVVSDAKFSNLTLALNNNLRPQDAIGSLPHIGVALGRLEVTGNISIYFEDSSMYDNYLNATAFALSFVMEDNDGNASVFTLPKIKFESGSVVAGGLDTDVMFEATWRAIMDPVTNCMIQIDKL